MDMSKNRLQHIYIKLGTSCNLHCKYCHAEHKDFVFNPAILPILKELKLKRIAFGGGEPLLYWDTIQQIVSYIGKDTQYKIVTNGTLFTQEIVDFCNQYKFLYFISLDGIDTTRDMSKPILWDLIKQLKSCATTVTFYRENQNIQKTLESLNDIKKLYLTAPAWIYSSFPNFVHSTEKTGILSDKELADSYIKQMTTIAEKAFILYKNNRVTGFLKSLFINFVKKKGFHGIRCCNDTYVPILADGTICACPYTFDRVGDIFHLDEIDGDKIKTDFTKKECASCELFDICGNYCCKEIIDSECYIMKKIHKNILDLMNKYDITYDELYKSLSN